MTHWNRSIFWVIFALTASFVVLSGVRRTSQTIEVSVSHVGTRKYKHWGMCCFFGVSNKSSFPVKRWPQFSVEDQNTGISSLVMYQENRYFGPGEGEIIVIQKPTNQGPWRLVLNYSRNSLTGRFGEIIGEYNWSQYIPLRLRAVPIDYFNSDWVKDE